MTAYYRVGIAQTGSSAPAFRETVICDNSSRDATFTLDDDMSNYDFIKFTTTNSSNNSTLDFVTTPTHLAQTFTVTSNGILFNEPASNQYVSYKVNGNTFTRYGQRNCNVTTVTGIVCTNKIVTEDVIYLAPSLNGSTDFSVSGTGLLDYDYIFFSGNAGAWDDTSICPTPAQPKSCFGVDTICVMTISYNYLARTYIRDTSIWGGRPLCITGVKLA